jgi:integrase
MNTLNTRPRKLTLVQNTNMGRQGYELSGDWETAVVNWLEWQRMSGLSPATLRLRRDHVRSIARRSGTASIRELTRAHLQIIVIQQQWSVEHRKAIRSSLNSFFEWAIANGLADDNVSQCLPKVRQPMPKPRPAPDRVWDELLAAAPPRERVMALLAGEAGLRRGEIAVVHCDDLVEEMDGWSLIVHGKGGKQRVVPLTPSLAAEIRTFCGSRGGYLFPGQIAGHISVQYVGVLLSRLMPPGWSAHTLRHRFASRGYAGTGNLRAVQEALGHSSVATTQRYTAVSSRDVRGVSDAAGRPQSKPPRESVNPSAAWSSYISQGVASMSTFGNAGVVA